MHQKEDKSKKQVTDDLEIHRSGGVSSVEDGAVSNSAPNAPVNLYNTNI